MFSIISLILSFIALYFSLNQHKKSILSSKYEELILNEEKFKKIAIDVAKISKDNYIPNVIEIKDLRNKIRDYIDNIIYYKYADKKFYNAIFGFTESMEDILIEKILNNLQNNEKELLQKNINELDHKTIELFEYINKNFYK